jgi:hypothetical protein
MVGNAHDECASVLKVGFFMLLTLVDWFPELLSASLAAQSAGCMMLAVRTMRFCNRQSVTVTATATTAVTIRHHHARVNFVMHCRCRIMACEAFGSKTEVTAASVVAISIISVHVDTPF